MQHQITGRAYVLGDNVDTDQIIPAQYLTLNPSIPEEYRAFGKYALSSVPAVDVFDRLADRLWFRPGESTLRRAVRHMLVVDLYVVLLMLVPVGFVLWSDWPAGVLLYGGSALVTVSAFMFAFTFLSDRLWMAVYGPAGPAWVKAVLITVAAALLFPGLAAVALVSDTVGRLLTAPLDPWAILALMVSVVVGLAAITRLTAARWREHQEWETLDLG